MIKKKVFLILFLIPLFLYSYLRVSANDLEDKENQIQALEKKVADLKKQSTTLAGQIVYYDSQIQLTNLKITQSEGLITSISDKINQLETRLTERANILETQIVQTYKQGNLEPVSLILSSGNFSDLVSKFKYLQIVQSNNRKFLHDTQVVQSNYSSQKTLMEQSKKKLEAQKKNLDSLKIEKDNLLKQTKNDEVIYQKQLEIARQELESIEKALIAGKSEGSVKKGEPIALMGNSGYPNCSTGAHLHFEVRVNDEWVNAESYLTNMTDKWGLKIGSGKWDWPMRGDIQITQRYGKTPYSYRYIYSGGIHTGIDMVSNDQVIRAVDDGTLYSYVGKCGSSDLKIKYIDHGNGLKSLYLHVQ